jgi:NAD(P)-dependent dehydrogenase (short-subunit alcohol dehydrogenase family)
MLSGYGAERTARDKTMATYLVTGVNRGIGLALVEGLLARGHAVIGTTRNGEAPFEHPNFRVLACDLGDTASVRAAAQALLEPIDVLIQNAGVFGPRRQELADLSPDDFLDVLNANVVGPWRVLQAFLPNLKRSSQARVLMISSGMGRFSGASQGAPAYRASKAALNKLVQTFSHDLERDGIAIVACHPGWVRTDMGGAGAEIDPKASADGLIQLAENLQLSGTGRFMDWTGHTQDW